MRCAIFSMIMLVFITINGCAGLNRSVDFSNPIAVSSAIKTEYDSFEKVTKYTGPDCGGYSHVYLRAWKYDKTGTIDYQIYINDSYPYEWRLYNRAFDSNGNQLDFTSISREVIGCDKSYCSYSEHFVLKVTREYLQNNQESGLSFKASGKTEAYQVFKIPPTYIKAFLSVVK